ncbi:LysM repeat protein [Curtobacterium sp. PvP017]
MTANGSVTGGPLSFVYTVASGDAVTGIAARFSLCTADIYLANEEPEVYGHELAVGQQLTIRRMAGPGHTAEQCDQPYPDGVY